MPSVDDDGTTGLLLLSSFGKSNIQLITGNNLQVIVSEGEEEDEEELKKDSFLFIMANLLVFITTSCSNPTDLFLEPWSRVQEPNVQEPRNLI